MSQFFILGLSFCFMSKNFLTFFKTFCSRFHKIKSRPYIKNLGHGSLHMIFMNIHNKFQELSCNIK